MLSNAMRRCATPAAVLLACAMVVGLTACSEKPAASPATAETVACVNSVCPIMSNTMDSAKVPVSLTRDFNGQKIGFCCGACPESWDKLTEEQKITKLAVAMAKAAAK